MRDQRKRVSGSVFLIAAAVHSILLLFSLKSVVYASDGGDAVMLDENRLKEDGLSYGEVEEEVQNAFWEDVNTEDLDRVLEDIFPEEKVSFAEITGEIIKGEMELDAELLNRLVKDQLFYAFQVNRKSIVTLLAIAVAASLFMNLSGIFQTRQVSEISFFSFYMMLIGICVLSFRSASEWVEDGIRILTDFMKVLCPIFFAAVTVAKGSITSGTFYHLALLLILGVELVILKLVVPMIHVYVIIKILGSMQEDYLSRLSELLEMIIRWILKAVLGFVIGLNTVQGLIAPAVDSVKRSVISRGVEAIPGVGDALGGTAEVAAGAAVVIKNSIGLAGILIAAVICLSPLVQTGLITLLYKLAAALVQPVSDKRITECISGVGDGCRLLLQTVFTCGVLFLITIAIASYTTSSV